MQTKDTFTPGPWVVERSSEKSGWSGISVRAPSGAYLANLVFQLTENERANARLIAAAPALLEALRECVTDNPGAACYNTGKKTRRLEAINDIVRAAIKAATGE